MKQNGPLYRIWHFLWYEDSWLSYTALILLAFLAIKFLVYPGIGLAMGTKLPVVAVVSGSMEHSQPFDDWWLIQQNIYQGFDITKEQFKTFPFQNGFNIGDIIILVGTTPDKVKVGDVIVYQSAKPYPIIHRVIETDPWQMKFQTKGDHNLGQIVGTDLNEQDVKYDSLIGKAVLRVPYLGYVKIGAVNGLNAIGIPVSG